MGVSPHTGAIRLGVSLGVLIGAVLTLLSACGTPPPPPHDSPPLAGPSAVPLSLPASMPGVAPTLPPTLATTPTFGTYPTYTTYPTYPAPAYTTTTPATTVSPTPTPSHAARCTGSPTGAQILTLLKTRKGIPNKTFKVTDGPYCSGTWSFTTVEVAGANPDQLEPLMVVATGKDATLKVFEAGSDVCTFQVHRDAPPGIRVLACGE